MTTPPVSDAELFRNYDSRSRVLLRTIEMLRRMELTEPPTHDDVEFAIQVAETWTL
jgi:hypothetical protein